MPFSTTQKYRYSPARLECIEDASYNIEKEAERRKVTLVNITRLTARNWRNFRLIDIPISNRLFVVGPNAAGKSNLLDIFRFLSDIASEGGGLHTAVWRRGGTHRIQSLYADSYGQEAIEIDVAISDGKDTWRYCLAFEGYAGHIVITKEVVECNGEIILQRPNKDDFEDEILLSQTHLEQVGFNKKFRNLTNYFASVLYFHPVPQIIRDPNSVVSGDSQQYGSTLIEQMINVSEAIVDQTGMFFARKRLLEALRAAIPSLDSIDVARDTTGRPHLVMYSRDWAEVPFSYSEDSRASLNEAELSDGTLRLIGLLWALITAPDNGLFLLEEPEISLNNAIIRKLPTVLALAQRDHNLQTIVSTHAPTILDDEGINPDEILVLRPTNQGTRAELLSQIHEVRGDISAGLPVSDTVSSLIDPIDLANLIAAGGTTSR